MKLWSRFSRILGNASLILGLLIGGLINSAGAEQYAPNEIIVAYKMEKASNIRQLAQTLGWQVKRDLPELKAGVLKVPAGLSPKAAARDLAGRAEVRFAEPNYQRFSLEVLPAPNDPGFNNIHSYYGAYYQWNLHQISALEGWSIWPGLYYTAATKPQDAVKVAVIDTGVAPGHPDFINDGGASSNAAYGGQIDYASSANLITGTFGSGFGDGHGHGTHVSGVIAASANNGLSVSMGGGGIAGLGYNAQIMALKVLDNSGSGTVQDVVEAIIYAADQGARVINLSLGSGDYSRLEQEAVNYAWEKGAIVVAAAGNAGNTTPLYPAGDNRVLTVSATGIDDKLAYYSSYGVAVGIAAPGGDAAQGPGIWSTLPGTYEYWQGTSMATPHVAGLAALYIGYRQELDGYYPSPLEVYQAIQRGADGIGGSSNGGWGAYYGYGRINVYATLAELNNRGATVGGICGQVNYQGIPQSYLTVTATALAGGNSYTTVSRTNGCYRLVNLPAGVYTVTSSASGLTATAENVTVTAGCDVPGIDLELAVPPDPTGVVVGVVTDQLTGLPVSAALTLRSKNLTRAKRVALVVTSNPETGAFNFGELPVARYTLQAVADGYRKKKIGNIRVTADTTTTVDCILKPRKK